MEQPGSNGPTYTTGGPIDGLSTIPAWSFSTLGDIKFLSPARSVQYVLLTPAGSTVVNNDNGVGAIHEFTLDQNYPNPFNPSTTLRYGLPTRSHMQLRVYNVLGQIVAELVNSELEAGWNQVVWNANATSGLYFYRLEAVSVSDPGKRFVDVKKMILLK